MMLPTIHSNGTSRKELLPCATCPWRVDKDATTIPRYVHEMACGLMDTVGDDDDSRKIMACHHSTETDMVACKGYLARAGWSNINVRILGSYGRIANPSDVIDACRDGGVDLEEDYPAVLAKLSKSLGGLPMLGKERENMKEGWTYLYNSPKWHYFRNSRSLCGRWMYLGKDEELQSGNESSPDNCPTCRKKLEKERAVAKRKAAKSLSV